VKQALTLLAVVAFGGLGLTDLIAHDTKVGVASMLLAVANGLLLL
jgi:hypothetical protein